MRGDLHTGGHAVGGYIDIFAIRAIHLIAPAAPR